MRCIPPVTNLINCFRVVQIESNRAELQNEVQWLMEFGQNMAKLSAWCQTMPDLDVESFVLSQIQERTGWGFPFPGGWKRSDRIRQPVAAVACPACKSMWLLGLLGVEKVWETIRYLAARGYKMILKCFDFVVAYHKVSPNITKVSQSITQISKYRKISQIYGSVSKPCSPGEHQNSW